MNRASTESELSTQSLEHHNETLSNRRVEKEKAAEENELFKSALRSLLRSELMRTHHHAMRDGHASTVDKEIMERTYRSYHNLGGNGIATTLHDEMMALPTIDD